MPATSGPWRRPRSAGRRSLEGGVSEPVDVPEDEPARHQRLLRTHDHPPAGGVELDDEQRLAGRDPEATALADGVVDDALVPPEHAPIQMNDLARLRRVGAQSLDHVGILALRHEADVLAVVLVGHFQAEVARHRPHLRLRQAAERKAEEVQLLRRGGEEEVALVAVEIDGTEQRPPPVGKPLRADVVPGRERLRAELPRRVEKIGELDGLVAGHARDRRLARDVAFREAIDHRVPEAGFVVEHVMRDAEHRRHLARVVDVLAGAAGAFPVGGLAVVVELQRHPDDVIALALQEPRHDRRIHAAGHGDDDPGLFRTARQIERVEHPQLRLSWMAAPRRRPARSGEPPLPAGNLCRVARETPAARHRPRPVEVGGT